ncbi:four helix bundle protein [Christiangramia sabulilitoris]|uniref:Four helix bundle protein n=1 Tax=Christiangramia sabulilitoris TaxID=2583991 RepID=A0A550I6U2_9FLAO|nr:four helix bundle protein [Christiangramia sabulilitoris]TRO66689.1 four helix bundle protein [Christiangramia sabulilitoris]
MYKLEDLKVWTKAMKVAKDIYVLSSAFPSAEKFGLTSQIRRSAISIASNIAEGAGRNTKGEFRNFLSIASDSSYELFTQLTLAYNLNLTSENLVQPILEEVVEIQKMNYSLIKTLV